MRNANLIISAIVCVLCLGAGILIGKEASVPGVQTPTVAVKDTTIRGMHYLIWTEPRTGDLIVCNTTIDSLRTAMFNDQIR